MKTPQQHQAVVNRLWIMNTARFIVILMCLIIKSANISNYTSHTGSQSQLLQTCISVLWYYENLSRTGSVVTVVDRL